MNQTLMGTIMLGQAIILAVGCWFYMWGGRDGKWKRRFIGSLICSMALWIGLIFSGKFEWWALGVYPLLIIAFSLGYGSDIQIKKIIKRLIISLYVSLTGLLLCLIYGGSSWNILPLQILIALGSVWLGVKNPAQAPVEEFFVCLLLTECLLLYPWI
jgi:hypothetical protein